MSAGTRAKAAVTYNRHDVDTALAIMALPNFNTVQTVKRYKEAGRHVDLEVEARNLLTSNGHDGFKQALDRMVKADRTPDNTVQEKRERAARHLLSELLK